MKTKKKCSKCEVEKKLSEFHKDKQKKDGYRPACKICRNLENNIYRSNNKEKISISNKKYEEENKEKITERKKLYRINNPEKVAGQKKKYKDENKDKISKQSKIYYDENRDEILKKNRLDYQKNKEEVGKKNKIYEQKNRDKIRIRKKEYLKCNPSYRLSCLIRTRIGNAIRFQYGEKAYSTIELLGCTIEKTRDHLEKQFDKNMTWDNYGKYGWNIDHIRPCASFDLTNPEQQKQCFHYTNLQPLWAKDNSSKGSLYNGVRYLNG